MNGESDNIQEVVNSIYLGIVKMIAEGKSKNEIMDLFLINNLPKDFIENIYSRALQKFFESISGLNFHAIVDLSFDKNSRWLLERHIANCHSGDF